MTRNGTSISLSDEDLGEEFRALKEASDKNTNDEFIRSLIDDEEEVEIQLEDLETVELEKTEEAKETRAMAVGVLEAMQQTGIKEDVIDLIEELRKREMVEMNKKVIRYLLKKAQAGESLNEVDRSLIEMVTTIESNRDDSSAATAIAEGLFGEVEEAKTESTTTEQTTSSKTADVEVSSGSIEEPLFDDQEDV